MSDPNDPPNDPTATPLGAAPADAPPPRSRPIPRGPARTDFAEAPRTAAQEYDDALDDARDAVETNRYRALGRFLTVAWETFGAGLLDRLSDLMEEIQEANIEQRAAETLDDDTGVGDAGSDNATDLDADADLTHYKRQPNGGIRATALRFDPESGTFTRLDGSPAPEAVPPRVMDVINTIRAALGAALTQNGAPEPAVAPQPDKNASDAPGASDA